MNLTSKLRSFLRSVNALRAREGPYRFVVRQWTGLSDINLAADVLNTEFFRLELEPIPLPIEKARSILVLAPHQDDETIGAGGALLLAARAGARIHVLFLTDGDAEVSSPQLVQRRNAEAEAVCQAFGGRIHQLGIANSSPAPTEEDLDRLREVLEETEPEVVLAPWLLDSPPKHRMVSHLLWLAHQRNRLPDCEVWGYQVHNALLPNGYVDITAVVEGKRKLLDLYRSQNEEYTNYTHQTMGLAAWNAHYLRSTTPRYLEVFFALPLQEMLQLVERFYFKDLHATYRGCPILKQTMSSLHRLVLQGKDEIRTLARSKSASVVLQALFWCAA